MPELPEVETVCRSLAQTALHQKIESVTVRLPRLIVTPDAEEFCRAMTDDAFCGVRRRGKYILLDCDSGRTLAVHLRMTGKLLYLPQDAPADKHDHVVWTLAGGMTLRFNDVRQFGTLRLAETSRVLSLDGLAELGVEPLGDEFTVEWLKARLAGRPQKIKAFLLDQRQIAGIGNIYADEILFQARVHPETPAALLADAETARALWLAVRDRLEEGIRCGGSSIRDYVDALGRSGGFQQQHRVYGRAGQPCVDCGCTLAKTRVGGRGTVYCPNCQPRRQ